jgi:hypothetical protein
MSHSNDKMAGTEKMADIQKWLRHKNGMADKKMESLTKEIEWLT